MQPINIYSGISAILHPRSNTEQCYKHAEFESLPLKSVHQKANVKVFVKSENMSIISLEYVQKSKIVTYSLSTSLT